MSTFRKNAGIIHPTTEVRWLSDSGDRNSLCHDHLHSGAIFARLDVIEIYTT
jgi:hypothetical protein